MHTRDGWTRGQFAAVWLFYLSSRAWLFGRWSGPNAWMYAYFADAVSVGRNPYTMPPGTVAPEWADYPPIWMVAFGALAQWMSGDMAVKLVCYAGDLALFVATLRICRDRHPNDRAATLALVLVNPGYLFADLWLVQYKSWASAGLLCLTWTDSALISGCLCGAFVLPMAIPIARWFEDRNTRALALSAGVAAAMWIPWFPSSAERVFLRRTGKAMLGAQSEALAQLLPDAIRPFFAVGAVLAATWIIARSRSPLAVRFSAAAALFFACMNESQLNRWLPFALVVFIAAPVSARTRWLALGLCAISGAGLWHKLVSGTNVFDVLAINSSMAMAVVLTCRRGNGLRDNQIVSTPEVIEQVGSVNRRV
jgi:hypothetical protein